MQPAQLRTGPRKPRKSGLDKRLNLQYQSRFLYREFLPQQSNQDADRCQSIHKQVSSLSYLQFGSACSSGLSGLHDGNNSPLTKECVLEITVCFRFKFCQSLNIFSSVLSGLVLRFQLWNQPTTDSTSVGKSFNINFLI